MRYRYFMAAALAAVAVPACLIGRSNASDHADTPEIAASPGSDLTDVYVFQNPKDTDRVVLAMSVHPLIAPGQGGKVSFDPNVLYQFKIDNDGDAVEDLVVQAKFEGNGRDQKVMIYGPVAPSTTGDFNVVERRMQSVTGELNKKLMGSDDIWAFAGPREDSFFFDLEQFFTILPDRAYPITKVAIADPNTPKAASWREAGKAVDFLSNGGFNVLSIVVEVPKKLLRGAKGSVIGVWATTNVLNGSGFRQMDRLARPAVNEVFATVANDRHKMNDLSQPSQDKDILANDIQGFMTGVAGRSQAITDVVKAVLIPDVIKADLNANGTAYLGVETGGATGGKFGGRALKDDVVDTSLGVIFGNTVSALKLAPDDNKEIPTLTSDHVGADGKHFSSSFPYLGSPR
jgi:hypothetical protein